MEQFAQNFQESAQVPSGVVLDGLFARTSRADSNSVIASSCTSDWRQVQPGDVFVAIADDQGDGHDRAGEASCRGALAIVCERPVPVFDVPTYLVDDTRVAFGTLCHALVDNPTRTLPTIGVTGTQGKTTTVALLESIFATAGRHAGTLSDLGCYDGMTYSAGLGESPSPTALALKLANMSAAACTHAVVEISSRSLAQVRLAGVQLDAVCVTNVTSGHLDWHHSADNYRAVKRRILDYRSPNGVVVLCADDPVSMSWLGSISGPVLTYGLGSQAEITGSIIQQNAGEQMFVISAGSESAAVRTTIVGEHHISNCLGAAATALSYGIDLQTIARGIEALDRLPCRMERVDCGQGFPVFVDVANTPDALRTSLRTARQLAERRVICVLGNASALEHETMHAIARRLADVAVVVGEGWSEQADDSDSDWLQVVDDRGEAIACAVAIAEPGDVVVIAGSQQGPLASFGQQVATADDIEVAKQLLYARNKAVCRLAA